MLQIQGESAMTWCHMVLVQPLHNHEMAMATHVRRVVEMYSFEVALSNELSFGTCN
jgi:hypothetical protein